MHSFTDVALMMMMMMTQMMTMTQMFTDVILMFYRLSVHSFPDIVLGTSAISRYCTRNCGFWLCFEPSFDAKINEAKKY